MSDWRAPLEAVTRRYGVDAAGTRRLEAILEYVRHEPSAPTTVREPSVAVHAHVEDSLTALELPEVREARRIADLGSGAGFPGVPLAVALAEAEVTLVESVGRKCAFLRELVDAAGVRNASVACARIEEWPGREVDVVCARAVAPLAVLVEYAAPVLRLGGALVAWKGGRDPDEERGGVEAASQVGLEPARVMALAPFPGADRRTLHVYLKVSDTPPRFPRRAGMARKRPLST